MALEQWLNRLVEQVGEELAGKLLQGLSDAIATGRLGFDEVYQFLCAGGAGLQAEDEVFAMGPGPHRRMLRIIGGPPGMGPGPVPPPVSLPPWIHPGGRPNVVGFYARLYEEAQDKAAVLRLAENQLSKTSLWRLKRRLGLE